MKIEPKIEPLFIKSNNVVYYYYLLLYLNNISASVYLMIEDDVNPIFKCEYLKKKKIYYLQTVYKNGLGVQRAMLKVLVSGPMTVVTLVAVAVNVVVKRKVKCKADVKLEAKLDTALDTPLTPGKTEATPEATLETALETKAGTKPKRRPTQSFWRPTMSTSIGGSLDDSKPSNPRLLGALFKLTNWVVSILTISK